MILTARELERRHIRRADYIACTDAFIDVRIPGSMPKENYSMIGPGVTQNADQPINLREPHGFNIGAAGLPPGVVNNLHLHFTAEVFFCMSSAWTLRWGASGDDGCLELGIGDVMCIPPWIFRGFSNSGAEYGFLMTVLGGDDTGGIVWSPDVVARARATGMYLGRDNTLIDVGPDGAPPDASRLMPTMPDDEVARLPRWTAADLGSRRVRRAARDFRAATLDTAAGFDWALAPVAGFGLSQHRAHRPAVTEPQGFSIEWLRVPPRGCSAPFTLDEPAALVHFEGPLALEFNEDVDTLVRDVGPWDTVSLPAGTRRRFVNTGDIAAESLLIVRGDARKPPRFDDAIAARAASIDVALDAGGYLARRSLLPRGAA